MKKVDFFKKLSELTKIDVETLTKAISSETEDIEIELPDVHVFTQEELNTRDLNSSRKGNQTAIEMAIKEARNKIKEQYGDEFDFQGKTMDNLLETAIKVGKKEAGVEPSKQIQEKDKVIKALQDSVQKLEGEKNEAQQNMTQYKLNYTADSTILKNIPFVENSTISAEDWATIFKKTFSPVEFEGILTYKVNGEVARDPKTQNIIPLETKVKEWVMEKCIVNTQFKGRGAGDNNSGGDGKMKHSDIKTGTDYHNYIKENKLGTTESVKLLNEIYAENPKFELEK
jgi:hypothetical protein